MNKVLLVSEEVELTKSVSFEALCPLRFIILQHIYHFPIKISTLTHSTPSPGSPQGPHFDPPTPVLSVKGLLFGYNMSRKCEIFNS